MKAYILKIFAIFIIVGIGEIMIPESGIKKYAKVLMSILVFHTLLSPVGKFIPFDIAAEKESAVLYDNFDEMVLQEYKKRIEENILANGAFECAVTLNDDMTIKNVFVKTGDREAVVNYIKSNLGVLESEIEVREN